MYADAVLEFYGNLLENGKYLFDVTAVKDEAALARSHLESIARHAAAAIAAQPASEG
jgi:hypothetical protein